MTDRDNAHDEVSDERLDYRLRDMGIQCCDIAADRLAALREKLEAAEAEAQRLIGNTTRFPDHMARIVAAKDQPLPHRIAEIVAAMEKLPDYLHQYQWLADDKPLFGNKRIAVGGDNGEGMGRQYIADTPSHLKGLAEYIALVNPDTVAMLVADLTEARAQLDAASGRAYDLAVAIMGGEDAPGYADSIPTQELVDMQRNMAAEWMECRPVKTAGEGE